MGISPPGLFWRVKGDTGWEVFSKNAGIQYMPVGVGDFFVGGGEGYGRGQWGEEGSGQEAGAGRSGA